MQVSKSLSAIVGVSFVIALTASATFPGIARGEASSPLSSAGPASPASVADSPATSIKAQPADNLDGAVKESKETLRRLNGAAGDMLHEVTRTEEIYNNGVPVGKNYGAISGSPMYQMDGGQTLQDAASHAVYLPPRPHWLNNSYDQLTDFQKKIVVDAADIKRILADPSCDSAVRAQGSVFYDIVGELGQDLSALKLDISVDVPVGAKINVSTHKIIDTISGLERVLDRIWKEAPKALKKK